MKIGFIGLGIMGSRMAANLQKAGHDLVVWNRSQDKAQPLIANGATWAASPAALAQSAEIIITMLTEPNVVRKVAVGEDGFLTTLSSNALWIDTTTTHPSFVRHMASEAKSRDIRYIAAPVAGSKIQARDAALVFFAGGDSADIDQATSYLETMGQRIVNAGAVDAGISLKLVVNHLLGTSMAAFAEALALGEGLNIPRETLLNVLIGGVVVPPYMGSKKEFLASAEYEPEFPLRLMQKDMHMVGLTVFETGTPMPLANLTKELFQQSVKDGFGDADFSAIAR